MRGPKEGLTGLTEWSLSQIEGREKVAPVIKSHIIELGELSDEDMRLVLRGIRLDPYNVISAQTRLRENAFNFLAEKQIGSVAKHNKWDLHSDEVKYMSGAMIQPYIDRRVEWLSEQVDNLKNGKRRYLTEEKSRQHLDKEEGEISRLNGINRTIAQNLEFLASASFLSRENGDKYVMVLRQLAMIFELKSNDYSRDQIKREISKFLKVGDINSAYNYLFGMFGRLESLDYPSYEDQATF